MSQYELSFFLAHESTLHQGQLWIVLLCVLIVMVVCSYSFNIAQFLTKCLLPNPLSHFHFKSSHTFHELGSVKQNENYLCRSQPPYPVVAASHPQESNQLAVGLTDGSVKVIEPLESEGQWGASPPAENGLLITRTASSSTTSNHTPDQIQRWDLSPPLLLVSKFFWLVFYRFSFLDICFYIKCLLSHVRLTIKNGLDILVYCICLYYLIHNYAVLHSILQEYSMCMQWFFTYSGRIHSHLFFTQKIV